MSTPTAAQIKALLNFLEEHRELARGNEGRVTSHPLWDEISTTLNSMGGCTKTTEQWQKVTQETVAATQSMEEDQSQLSDTQPLELQVLPSTSQQEASATHGSEDQITEFTSRRQTRRSQRLQFRPTASVRERLFSLEERRELREEKRNEELVSIRVALFELVKLMQQVVEELRAKC